MFYNPFQPLPPDGRARIPESLDGAVTMGTERAVALWLSETNNLNRATQLDELSREQSTKLATLLNPETAEELLESVSPHSALRFLREMPDASVGGLLDALDSDVAARIVDLMDDDEAGRALRSMQISQATTVRGLLAWPDDSAGSRMRAEFLHVGPEATIADAVEAARSEPDDIEDGVFVTRETNGVHWLLGWLSPAALVLGKRADPVTSLMMPAKKIKQWSLEPLADQEAVAHRVRANDSQIVPVMEGDQILGVISLDQARDIASEEATEDAERQGGSAPLEVPYLKASPGLLWTKRVGWLLILFVAEMYTGTVLRAFEDELEAVVALSFFVPLLIGTGGNVGTQITTTLIRAMGQGEVRLRNLARVIWKELRTGFLLALTMAAAGAIRAWTLGVIPGVIVTVAIALACIVLWSSFISAILPLLLKRIGFDPAVVSGPMISTVVDGTGLMIYFWIAKMVLGL